MEWGQWAQSFFALKALCLGVWLGVRGSPRSPIAESSEIKVPLDVLMQTLASLLTSNYNDVD